MEAGVHIKPQQLPLEDTFICLGKKAKILDAGLLLADRKAFNAGQAYTNIS